MKTQPVKSRPAQSKWNSALERESPTTSSNVGVLTDFDRSSSSHRPIHDVWVDEETEIEVSKGAERSSRLEQTEQRRSDQGEILQHPTARRAEPQEYANSKSTVRARSRDPQPVEQVNPQPSQGSPNKRPSLSLPFENVSRAVNRQPTSELIQQQVTSDLKQLGTQVNHVNQLSAELETALFQLKDIAVKINHGQRTIQTGKVSANSETDLTNVFQFTNPGIPQVKPAENGAFKLTMRRIDLLKAEREAVSVAQYLRGRSPNQPSPKTRKATRTHSQEKPKSPRRYWRWLRDFIQPPSGLFAIAIDAGAWVMAAALTRVGLQLLLTMYPTLWPPVVLLLITPVMIAAYQVTLMEKSGFTLGYRLLLLLFGLLVGGRV